MLGAIGLLVASAAPLSPAQAEGLQLATDLQPDLSALTTGDQLVAENQSGTIRFAGREIALANFSGIFGYSSEVGYIVTIEGTARTGNLRTKRGRIMLLEPYGGQVSVERFDARRLASAWQETSPGLAPATFASLDRLTGRQGLGFAFGRLGRTALNVTAPGSATTEIARRSVIGGPTVRELRFGAQTEPEAVERAIVERLVLALQQGDAAALAELIDPQPFGNGALDQGASEARMQLALALVEERAWSSQLNQPQIERGDGDNVWIVRGTGGPIAITMRPMAGFSYVRSVSVGG